MSALEKSVGRTAHLSFLECELKGYWNRIELTVGYEWHYYIAKDDSAELWLVRADGLKRAFNFRKGSKIQVGMMIVMFTNEDMVQEIAVDEDERAGRGSRSKLKFD
jgi:hypothetical protein